MSVFSSISAENPVLLIGCGKMGGAMLDGWLEQGLTADAVQIVDPFLDPIRENFPTIPAKNMHETADSLSKSIKPSFMIMAVKPQMMDAAVERLQSLDLSKTVILSVAAGKMFSYFEETFGKEQAIIRAMPNTPAAIGKGMTVCTANTPVTDTQKEIASTLLAAVGQVDWVNEEALIDVVTALSGSGPAYVFHMVEAMAAAGHSLGLTEELAKKLARGTIVGAGALLDASDDPVSTLRENVTSPNGTTAAALDVLMGDEGLAKLMRRAMQEAKNRSKELAG